MAQWCNKSLAARYRHRLCSYFFFFPFLSDDAFGVHFSRSVSLDETNPTTKTKPLPPKKKKSVGKRTKNCPPLSTASFCPQPKRKKKEFCIWTVLPWRISFSFSHQPFRKLQSPSNGHDNNCARVSPWAFVRLKIRPSLTTRFFRKWMREKRKQQRTAVVLKVFGSISFALCFSEFSNGCAHVVEPFQR